MGDVLPADLGTDIVLKHRCSDFGLKLKQDSERMVLLFLALERCLNKLRAQIFGRFVEIRVSFRVVVLGVVCLHASRGDTEQGPDPVRVLTSVQRS